MAFLLESRARNGFAAEHWSQQTAFGEALNVGGRFINSGRHKGQDKYLCEKHNVFSS